MRRVYMGVLAIENRWIGAFFDAIAVRLSATTKC